MSDLPGQSLLQQMHAKPKSGEELEVLGKTAASKWLSGSAKTLTESVIDTVKHASLSPEQVKRVCEFANTDAFLREFKKESSVDHKVVDFAGGPADSGAVLQELNSGGGGTVFDSGTGDYHAPPTEKKASDQRAEDALEQAFGTDSGLPYAEPLIDVMDMRDKLGGAYDHLSTQLSGLETAYADLSDELYRQVKQAALEGASLGDIAQVLQAGAPSDEFMKIAFQVMTPRLLKDCVFNGIDQALESMDKTASNRVVNRSHPMVTTMSEFSDCLQKLAHTRLARNEVNSGQAAATAFLKKAGKDGLILRGARAVHEGAKKVAPHAGRAAEKIVGKLVHEGAGKTIGKATETAVKHAPTAVAAAAVLEGARRASNNPTLSGAYHGAQAHLNPMSQDWDNETARERGYGN